MLWRWARPSWLPVVTAAILISTLGGCGGAPRASKVSISVTPDTALLDVPVNVSITGLAAGREVKVTAQAVDASGVTWTGAARYRASARGIVTLSQPSLGGSYTGTNAMGLFEFMAPSAAGRPIADQVFLAPAAGYTVGLTAVVDGRVVARATTRRLTPQSVGVTYAPLTLTGDGVIGMIFRPKQTRAPHPAVLVFGGSEGGLNPTVSLEADLLAAHGFLTVALAYFKEPGLPDTLSGIPLEYFVSALRILRQQPGVDPAHVFAMGVSRGSEAALLLGANFPALVNGVIVGAPSSVDNPAYPSGTGAAWTLHGKPVPTVSSDELGNPNPADNQAAVIPVERIKGPILLDCGKEDTVWPSCAYEAAIVTRLDKARFAYPVDALYFANAGHAVGAMTAYFSATDHPGGGTLDGNQIGLAQSHTALLALLASQ